MGDAADDAFDSAWDWDASVRSATASLRRDCKDCIGHRVPLVRWNDDGLLECVRCHRMTDV